MNKRDIIEKTAKEAGISKLKAEKLVNGIAGLLLNELYNFKGKITTKYSKPEINISKLTEYMTSTPARRQTIVKNQKRKKAFFIDYHNEAKEIISKFISNDINEEKYWEEFYRIKNKKIHTDISEIRQDICLSALEEFEGIIYDVKFPEYQKKLGDKKQKKATLHRIKLAVNPEILLYNNEGTAVGAIKILFDKNNREKNKEHEYLSTILLQYMRVLYDMNIKNTDCYIIDVFEGTIKNSPMSYKKIMLDIKASCDEIRDLWKRV
jgi:hypothetical protein